MNILPSHLPLYVIHKTMRMLTNILNYFDLGYRDLFTLSSNHDVDSIIVNLCKPLVYEDLSVNEIETPETFEAL